MSNKRKIIQKAKAYITALLQDVANQIWYECKKPDETIGEAIGESTVDLSHCLLDARADADEAEKKYCEKTRKSVLSGIKTGFVRKVDKSLKE
jgi:hypothetical protein